MSFLSLICDIEPEGCKINSMDLSKIFNILAGRR